MVVTAPISSNLIERQQNVNQSVKATMPMLGGHSKQFKGPLARSIYAFELEVHDEHREFVLSELHPIGFPKRRQGGTASPETDAGIWRRAHDKASKEASKAYSEAMASFSLFRARSAREIFAADSGASEAARAEVVRKLGGSNGSPIAGWHRLRSSYVAPDGRLVRSSRDARKYIDANLKQTMTAVDGRPLNESHFRWDNDSRYNEELDQKAVDAALDAAWQAETDKARWFDAARAEQELAKQSREAADRQARSRAARAAVFAGVDLSTGAEIARSAHDHREDDQQKEAPVSAPAPTVVEQPPPLPPNEDLAPPKPAQSQKKATAKPSSRRYNVVERLERLFGGGELGLSDDDEDEGSVISYYDSDDSFIDDSEIVRTAEEREQAARTKPSDYDGFFASTGDIATRTLQAKPRKLIRIKKATLKKRKRDEPFIDAAQINSLLAANSPLAFEQVNPKRGESAVRYEAYKAARSFKQALDLGASKADLKNDMQKGFITLPGESQSGKDEEHPPDADEDPPAVKKQKTLITTLAVDETKEQNQPEIAPPAMDDAHTNKKKTAPTRDVSDGTQDDRRPQASNASSPSPIKKKPAARRLRCGICQGCTAEECGVCRFCLDRPKRGGENRLRQPCVRRTCIKLGPVAILPAGAETPRVAPAPSPGRDVIELTSVLDS